MTQKTFTVKAGVLIVPAYVDREEDFEAPNSQIDHVERNGFIPSKEQIEGMVNAGDVLRRYRASVYQYDTDLYGDNLSDDDLPINPTRKEFDMADATQIQLDYEAREADYLSKLKDVVKEHKLEQEKKQTVEPKDSTVSGEPKTT